MASIFKRGRDKNKRRASWWISFTDEAGKRVTKKGFTDKRLTEELALKLEQAAHLRKSGLVDAVTQRRETAAQLPISQHLAEFERSLALSSPNHIQLTMSRLRRVIGAAGFKKLPDLDADSIVAVLEDMLVRDKFGRKTYNHYVATMIQFGSWLVPNRMATNPMAGIDRLNAEVDVRHRRRALSEHEFSELVRSARESGVSIQGYDGEQRARIYIISYMTGLRRKEIASLTPSSFQLEVEPATVTIEAACSKHRREDVLPLHPALVKLLGNWLSGMERKELLFPKLAKRRTWLMVKKDLQRAGIPYVTDQGIADFHAAGRHTHITGLIKSGVTIVEAKQLARHSDVRMTMKYTHIGLKEQAEAIKKLPWNLPLEDPPFGDPEEGGWQRPGSEKRCPEGQTVSLAGKRGRGAGEKDCRINLNPKSTYDNICHGKSPTGTEHAVAEDTGLEPATGCPAPAFQAGR